MRAKYCRCKNTYTMTKCNERKCKFPDYWSQGIGSLTGGTVFNKTGVIEVGTIVSVEVIDGGEFLAGAPDHSYNLSHTSTDGEGTGASIKLNVVNQEAVSFDAVSEEGERYSIGDTINLTTGNSVTVREPIVRVTEIVVTGVSGGPRVSNSERAGLWD